MKTRLSILLFALTMTAVVILQQCSGPEKPEPLLIGISKGAPESSYGNYARWLGTIDTMVACVDLYHMPVDSALSLLDKCSGLVLSGGPDVYPGRYGQEADTALCDGIDLYRDTLEYALIARAIEKDLPVLGICRGLQIFNVYHGGSLYPDLPTVFDTAVAHRCDDWQNCNHDVSVVEGSGLQLTAGRLSGQVNSNHHQGIDRLADGLAASAYSSDSLIEAIEYADRRNIPFFLGVQWHPERMDLQNPFSMTIAMYFIQEAKLYRIDRQYAGD